MALALKFSICRKDNCKEFCVTETTGVYDASTNAGGWGNPNQEIAEVLTATITVSLLTDAATGTYAAATNVINAFPTLPNTDETEFCITAEDLGYGTDATFVDGIYKIVYAITGNDGSVFSASVTEYFFFDCNAQCCRKNAANDVSTCTCDCGDVNEKLADIDFWLRELKAAKDGADFVKGEKIFAKLTKICGDCGCSE